MLNKQKTVTMKNSTLVRNIRETLEGQPTAVKVVVFLTLAVILLAAIALITGLLAGATAAVFLSVPLATRKSAIPQADTQYTPGTRGYYLNQLPEPYRSRAFENARTQNLGGLNLKEDSLYDVIMVSFIWADTPQGREYWAEASKGNYPQAEPTPHAEPAFTRADYYNQLPEPYRAQAFENTRAEVLDIPCFDLADALTRGFVFADTPQGHKYWVDAVEGRFRKKEPTHKKK